MAKATYTATSRIKAGDKIIEAGESVQLDDEVDAEVIANSTEGKPKAASKKAASKKAAD